ncbi:MAG: oligosaccharide flippase family protein [Piscirickettsiaceae bacterium]|nr:oligosaccharide flippase family protein [Piscirickettsiaceae bacterium]
MIDVLKSKSEFTRNVLTLMTGSAIAQAIPVAISPILTRIYTPEDFGVFALYIAITALVSVIATGRYELAIMLPQKEDDAKKLVLLSIMITTLISVITLFIVFFYNEDIALLLGNEKIRPWLYFSPITIFFTGVYQSVRYWSNRQKSFKQLAVNRIVQSSSSAATQIGVADIIPGGLIVGNVVGQGISTAVLIKFFWENNKLKKGKKTFYLKYIALLRRYKKLPYFSMPMGFINTLSNQIKPLVFSSLFSATIVGWVFMAERMLNTPLSMISNSFHSVFFQKFVNTDKKVEIYIKSYFLLLILALVILSPIYLWGEQIFSIVFGDNWTVAGNIASMMSPMLCFSFAVSSISTVFTALEKNEISLIWQIIYFLGIAAVIYSNYLEGYLFVIEYLVIWGVIMYFVLFLLGLYQVKKYLSKTTENKMPAKL